MHLFSRASVIDGTGKPMFAADIVVEDDTITGILPPGTIDQSVGHDCSGLLLCPGFIDVHGHSDLHVLRNPPLSEKIRQGITTEVSGNCGIGVFPSPPDFTTIKELTTDVLGSYDDTLFDDFPSYLAKLQQKGCGTNMAFLQAHSPLRCHAMEGNVNRKACKREVQLMVGALEKSLDAGCLGFSSGLYYAPCMFADRYELNELLSCLSSYDRLFSVHMRCEGSEILSSALEVLNLAERNNVRLQISHLKVIGSHYQMLVAPLLKLIEQAAHKVDVQFDQYPYEYGSTSLFSLLPPSVLRLGRDTLETLLAKDAERERIQQEMEHPKGWDSLAALCGWEHICILTLSSNASYEGLTISEIARIRGQDPYAAFFDLLKEEQGTALMTDVTQSHESIKQILCHPLMCFGTDALYAGQKAHPRSYQAAIHLLDRYWKQEEVVPIELLISKMTAKPASRLRLADRGRIALHCKADLVLLDPKALKDCSDARHPDLPSSGVEMVMVNGKVAYRPEQGPKGCFGLPLLYS